MSAEKPRLDWAVLVLPVIGLVTAIAQAITALRGSQSPAPPAQPQQPPAPPAPPPTPPGRADAAITAEQHELVRQESARRSTPPPPPPELPPTLRPPAMPPAAASTPTPLPGAALRGVVLDPDATEPDEDDTLDPRDMQ
ncbi:hypothetical protein [Sorangium sp. So ce1024]|uniref:hypothetical protein n=1 Tax=Sorangium sp. So ce1024 TaxID=3133327 RepID=UPI003F081292